MKESLCKSVLNFLKEELTIYASSIVNVIMVSEKKNRLLLSCRSSYLENFGSGFWKKNISFLVHCSAIADHNVTVLVLQ